MTEQITSLDEKRRMRQLALEAQQMHEASSFIAQVFELERRMDAMHPDVLRLAFELCKCVLEMVMGKLAFALQSEKRAAS